MKDLDVYVGQDVGFTHKGTKYLGTVKDLQVEDEILLVTVDTPETEVIVPASKLLGVVKPLEET